MMAEDGTLGNGQEPQPGAVQEPTAGQEPAGPEPGERFDPEYVRKLRAESASYRARLRELEAASKAAEDAKLSEQERLSKRVAELEASASEQSRLLQERVLRYEVQLQAARLNIVDPDAALKLLDLSTIEYDPEGNPQDVDRALKALLKEKPYLVGPHVSGGNGSAAPKAAPSPTNPATRSQAAASQRRYSQADLADRDLYVANRDDIIRAYREGRIDS